MKIKILLTAIFLFSISSLPAQDHHGKEHVKPKKEVNKKDMKFEIPGSLKMEHKELHETLEKFTKLPGKTGIAAQEVATLLHPHFLKEEEYALPPLGLLPALSRGEVNADMKPAIEMSDKLKNEFQQMLSEHQQIVKVVQKLKDAAQAEQHTDVIRFTESLKLHAKTEEEVLYPTAILIGEYLKLKLK